VAVLARAELVVDDAIIAALPLGFQV